MISKIIENVYLCAAADVIETSLRELKITSVLNVSRETTSGPFHGIKVIKMGFYDDIKDIENSKPAIIKLKELLDEGETVLVHCRAGQSRSPHVITAALADIENREYEDVYEEVLKLRPIVHPTSLKAARDQYDVKFGR